MNAQMRRYLSEDWEEYDVPTTIERIRKQPTKATVDARRQNEKERGRTIAKFHRQERKAEPARKP